MSTVRLVTPPHPIQWLRDHQRAADALLAALITVAAVTFHILDLDTTEDHRSPSWWTTLLVIASTLPIAWRRSFPIRSGLFVVAARTRRRRKLEEEKARFESIDGQ